MFSKIILKKTIELHLFERNLYQTKVNKELDFSFSMVDFKQIHFSLNSPTNAFSSQLNIRQNN